MTEAVKIAITIQDGMIEVYSAGVPVDVLIVDYDTDGADLGETTQVDGKPAYVRAETASNDGPRVLAWFYDMAEESEA